MVYGLKQIPAATKRILASAICLSLAALLASAVILDEETEFGPPLERTFSQLFAFGLGPILMAAGLGGLLLSRRPHNRYLVPLSIAFMVFGGAMTWLFFFETTELPDFWPY